MTAITLETIKEAMKQLEDHRKAYPCHCRSKTIMLCNRHDTIHCDEETVKAIKELFGVKK